MTAAAERTRRRQRVDELCAAAVRALTGDPRLRTRGGRLYRDGAAIPATAPHLYPSPGDDFTSFRGAADGLALRHLHSDAALHRRLCPDGVAAGLVFEMLEQFRVETLAPRALPGVAANLRHRHGTWSAAFLRSGLTETAAGILLYTVAQAGRARVSGEPVAEVTEDLLEATRFALGPAIGAHLTALRRHRADQAAYAVPARAVAEHVAALLAGGPGGENGDVPPETRRRLGAFSLLLPAGADDEPPSPAGPGTVRAPVAAPEGYRVFTRAYDREHRAATLVRPARLAELRRRLDERIAGDRINVPRLALRLRDLLAEPVRDAWESGREEGLVDGGRLALLVTSPAERRLFRAETREPSADCLVTFLVDCSGSMRRYAETLAALLDVLVRALDLAGVTTELLGFTTGAWNGGRAVRDWRRAGRPAHPGRLNELCHVVFKDAGTPWRRARRGIAALLKEDLYREGVDGEAVAWACDRMRSRPERRRLLVVVSDGGPLDGATVLANGEDLLDRHLRDVVAAARRTGVARILGLGVGLDLSRYYPRSRVVNLERPLGEGLFRDVLDLLAGSGGP